MSAIGKVLLSPIAAVAGLFSKPKVTPPPIMAPPATPRANSAVRDALAARRGAAANRRTGNAGAEATGGLKTSLGG